MESPASQPDLVTHGSLSTAHLASSQSLPISSNPNRPPITKAIDIWALGITLYCLLFGRTPFVADPAVHGSEWSLYNAICNQDWAVDDTMAFDQVPTGGRHPVREDADGAIVIHLLDHLLEKDMKLRITLEEVKVSPRPSTPRQNPSSRCDQSIQTMILMLVALFACCLPFPPLHIAQSLVSPGSPRPAELAQGYFACED